MVCLFQGESKAEAEEGLYLDFSGCRTAAENHRRQFDQTNRCAFVSAMYEAAVKNDSENFQKVNGLARNQRLMWLQRTWNKFPLTTVLEPYSFSYTEHIRYCLSLFFVIKQQQKIYILLETFFIVCSLYSGIPEHGPGLSIDFHKPKVAKKKERKERRAGIRALLQDILGLQINSCWAQEKKILYLVSGNRKVSGAWQHLWKCV